MSRQPTLAALTGLRFFAAFGIFNLHTASFVPGLSPSTGYLERNLHIASFTGISLFFVLSGFILAYSYEPLGAAQEYRIKFWINRFARIYPVYLLALLWQAPVALAHRFAVEPHAVAAVKSAISFLASATLTQSWFDPRLSTSWNGPGWTLSVEATFYLLFPLLAARVKALPQRSLLATAAGLWYVSLSLSLLAPYFLSEWPYWGMFASFNPLFHLPTFAIGVVMGFHFLRSTPQAAPGSWTPVWALAAIALLILCVHKVSFLLVHNCLFVPAFALLIYGLARGGRTRTFFALPAVVLLGEASYSFYILQFPLGFTFRYLNEGRLSDFLVDLPQHGTLTGSTAYLVLLVVAVGASIIVHARFEVPMRHFIRRRLSLLTSSRKRTTARSPAPLPAR